MMNIKMRKGFFLATTARVGLHGGVIKDGEGHDSIEVGPGFANAPAVTGGDDTRPNDQRGAGMTQEIPDGEDQGGEDGENSGEDQGGEGDGETDADAKPKKPLDKEKQAANKVIRDLKRESREKDARLASMEARLAAVENPNSRSTNSDAPVKPDDTKGDAEPDPNNSAKYPLGLIDQGYQKDMALWGGREAYRTEQARERTREQQQREQQRASAEATTLGGKVRDLVDKGEELFPDYAEKVHEAGLRGDYALTKETLIAASEVEHGAQVLWDLAHDKAEATKVAAMSLTAQVRYVDAKNAEIAAGKPKPRHKPQAGDPPQNAPRGRNSSSPLRLDSDNLDDVRKLWYKK